MHLCTVNDPFRQVLACVVQYTINQQMISLSPTIRQAKAKDIVRLIAPMVASVRNFSTQNYSQQQVESAIGAGLLSTSLMSLMGISQADHILYKQANDIVQG